MNMNMDVDMISNSLNRYHTYLYTKNKGVDSIRVLKIKNKHLSDE
jgi:hypothetical protein